MSIRADDSVLAHIVEALRCCDCGVLNGAADACCFSCMKAFLEKYLLSASKMPFRGPKVRCGILLGRTQPAHEGHNLESMVLG